jgi:hypothetical protein
MISKNELEGFQAPEFSLASPKDLQELEKQVDQRNARLIFLT